MKTSDSFKRTIEEHLKFRAFTDPLFAVSLKKEGKNIDDCITYILNTVKDSKCAGFEDDEIFNMAFHYYSEDDIKVGKGSSTQNVVVNHQVKLTEAEIVEAHKIAYDAVISEEKKRLTTKKKKSSSVPNTPEQTLF